MKSIQILLVLFSFTFSFAQIPLFTPDTPIAADGIIDSPIGEEASNATDGDEMTKFLDFEWEDGIALVATLDSPKIAIALDFTTANDFPARDGMDFEILGSTDNNSFTSIATGPITCIDERFETRRFEFENETAYAFYKIILINPCDETGAGGIPSMQIAELQLFEPELGIEDNIFSTIVVSPNPSNGVFTISKTNQLSIQNIQIVNLQGAIIETIPFEDTNTIRVNAASGLYFLKFNSSEGSFLRQILIK